jgi:hypothetical protein
MMLYCLLPLLVSVFSFSGGSDEALASALRVALDAPVAVLRDDAPIRHPALEIQYEGRESLLEQLNAQLRVRVDPQSEVAVFPKGLPASSYYRAWNLRPAVASLGTRAGREVRLDVEGGLVNVAGADAMTIKAGELAKAKFSKPVSMHWFYRSMDVAVSARGADEVAFLQAVAAALGAELRADSEYEFSFDAAEFKKRALVTLAKPLEREDVRLQADRVFALEVLKITPDDLLREAYRDPNGAVEVPLPEKPAIIAAIGARFEARFGEGPANRNSSAMAIRLRILNDVDLNKPAKAELRASGMVLVKLPLSLPNEYVAF